MISRTMAPVRNGVSSPCWNQIMYLAVPTSPAARPPKACDSAVRCGTAVSGTHDSGTPITMPTSAAIAIHEKLTISGAKSVPMIARAMPPTPAATPRRAVFGWLSQRSERMKSAAAAR